MIKKNNEPEGFSSKIIHLLKINEEQAKKIKELEGDIFKWKSIGNTLPNSIYIKDRQGKYLWINDVSLKRLRELHGIHTNIIGKKDSDVFPKKAAKIYMENDQRILQTRKGNVHEEKIFLPNEKELVTLSFKEPLYNEIGDVAGILGYTVDITELKEAQSALQLALQKSEASNQAKTEFLENMRHDIRTPVSGMVGCAQIIQSQVDNPEKVSEYAKDLVRSSEALLEFLNKVLEGIKVATGEIPLLKKKFDIRKQLQAIIDLNKSLAAKKNLELSFNEDERIPPYLIGDPIRLQRIVLELVTNALNFTQQGKVDLSIKLKKQEAQRVVVEVSVTDTGVGIAKDKQEAIFVRFTRLTPSCQGIYKGLGLGLSIVKQFIDDLGGEIYVESQLNHGTVFTCLVPFQEPLLMDSSGVEDIPLVLESKAYPKTSKLRANRSTIDNDALGSQQRKILLVEDDPLAAKIAVSILSRLNGVIDRAPDANSALQRLQEQDYHLILMDIGLPDMDGISLTHRIRLQQWQCRDTTPIIGLTAHIDVENRQRCLDAGMNTVILKPLKKETALELLTTFVPDAYIHQELVHFDSKPLTGPVFDIESMQELLKENDLIKDCVNLMLTGLERDLAKLPRLHQVSDWKSIRELAHKLHGGSGYCGAKRLEQACQQIIDYLRENDSGERANVLYHQLTQEMMAAKAVYENYVEL